MYLYIFLIFNLISSILVSFYFYKVVINVSHKKKLYDSPSDERKLHGINMPNLGGFAMYFTYILFIMFSSCYFTELGISYYFLSAITIIFLLGLKDDLVGLSSNKRFFIQVFTGALLAYFGNFKIHELNGIFGITHLNNIQSFTLSIFLSLVVVAVARYIRQNCMQANKIV